MQHNNLTNMNFQMGDTDVQFFMVHKHEVAGVAD